MLHLIAISVKVAVFPCCLDGSDFAVETWEVENGDAYCALWWSARSCRIRLVVEWLLTVSSTRCKWKPFEKETLLIFWQICRRRSLVEIKKCYTSDTFLFIIYGRKFRFSRISYVLREVPSATSTDSLWKEWHYKLIHYKLLISLLC